MAVEPISLSDYRKATGPGDRYSATSCTPVFEIVYSSRCPYAGKIVNGNGFGILRVNEDDGFWIILVKPRLEVHRWQRIRDMQV